MNIPCALEKNVFYYYVDLSTNVSEHQLGTWVDNIDLVFCIFTDFSFVSYLSEKEMLKLQL